METVTITELKETTGGAWTFLKAFGTTLIAGLTFISAVVYGYFHPEKC